MKNKKRYDVIEELIENQLKLISVLGKIGFLVIVFVGFAILYHITTAIKWCI